MKPELHEPPACVPTARARARYQADAIEKTSAPCATGLVARADPRRVNLTSLVAKRPLFLRLVGSPATVVAVGDAAKIRIQDTFG